MRYDEIDEGLLSTVSENDPNRVPKQLQIKQWIYLYGYSLLRNSLSCHLNFVTQVIGDNECWKKVDKLERVKLDRYEVGRKLLAPITREGNTNPFDNLQQYQIACRCCFEDKIRELWNKVQNIAHDIPMINQLESIYNMHGPLVGYWTCYITGYTDKFKDQLKHKFGFTSDNNDLHGFQIAVREKCIEAIEYFWNRLQPVLSQEEKDNLLIDTVTCYKFRGEINSDMIDFVMNHLEKSKYRELLKRDFDKHQYCPVLSELMGSYLFDRVESLLIHISADIVNQDEYLTLIFSMFRSILEVPNDNMFINAGYSMVSTMWNMEEFQRYKPTFLQELADGAPTMDNIARLIEVSKLADVLSEIVRSFSIDQVKNLQESESWIYDILKEANLFHDDVKKYFAEVEQTNVCTSEVKDNVLLLGRSSNHGSQEVDNE